MRLRIGEAAPLICNINIKVGARRFNNNYRHAIQLAVPSYGIIYNYPCEDYLQVLTMLALP
jgi:hypothetical protein